MWPSGRGLVPYPATFQNFTAYNSGGFPDVQNQQGTIFTIPATYPPYSEQALPALYSQQVSRVGLPQDIMAGGMVPRHLNWLSQYRSRREGMLEYTNGEVVMVRCNQQKWLYGIIQRMSAQGLRIWIADANILVDVPLVLVPTHVLNLSMCSELQALPQPGAMWTMAITDNTGCRQALVQCVRPAYDSHRQLFHNFGSVECAICKRTVSLFDVVSPWNCSHQVHNYCLQRRMQHSSNSVCPSCIEMSTSPFMRLSSTDDGSTLRLMPPTFTGIGSTLRLMPPTFTGIGSTSRLMPSPSTSNALWSRSNEQRKLLLDLQCACGFRGSIDSDNMYAPVFCPNCHQLTNISPMTIGMQNGEPFASMGIPRSYSELSRENLQRKSVQDRGFGHWPMQPFSVPSSPDAIEEGSRRGICFKPPAPDQINKAREEPPYLRSCLLAFRGTYENSTSETDVVAVSSVDQSTEPSPSARSSLQDGALTSPSPTQRTPIQNKPSYFRSSREEICVLQKPAGQVGAQRSSQGGSLHASSSTRITPILDEESADNVLSPKELIGPAGSTHVNHVKFTEVVESDESAEIVLETETTTVAAPDSQRLWKIGVDHTRRNLDKDSEISAEASSSNDYAATAPSTPPVYVNHFANFVKLAMTSASTAKEILESASAPASSSTTDPPLLQPPTAAWVMPAQAAIVPPAPAYFTQDPALITEPPAWVTNGGGASPDWITVIKDGVDSRRDDAKQWELTKEVRKKESEFI